MRIFINKEFRNAGWIIGGKVVQMLISFFVGILTARYLGPSNYGLLNYAGAYTAFFTPLCTLGINSIIVKNFVDNPNEQGQTIGTTLILRGVSSFLSAITIIGIVSFIDYGEQTTIVVTALCSCALIFQIFDTINYWFQSKHQSKVTSMVTLIAYAIVSVYKIFLLVTGKSVKWFALSTAIDYMLIAVFLLIAYKKNNGPKLSFSLVKANNLLSKSYHFIISGLMVAIYGYIDKFMLKQMLGETAVGYYSTATTISSLWVFVLTAIIDSMYPTIMQLYGIDHEKFERKNRQLYSVVFYTSVIVSSVLSIFGGLIIKILYGNAYLPAINPLRIVTWCTSFTYLGVARNAWIVCENKQKFLKFMYIGTAIINIILNLVLIPMWGTSGAAIASLITQIFTSLIMPLIFKEMRPNAKLMIQAIFLKDILPRRKIK